jgi:general secretion pathway protein H
MCSPPVALVGGPVFATVPRRPRGFSLLEILFVLFIIGIITSMVSLTFTSGGQDVQLETTVRNLADVASYAVDEAQMTGVDFGLLLEEELEAGGVRYSYSWLERHIDGWEEPVSGKDLFARQHLPPGIALELELEDAPVVELSLDDNQEEIIRPQVIFYASGEATVGAINVRRLDDSELLWRIEWDLLGRFDLLRRGEVTEEEEY